MNGHLRRLFFDKRDYELLSIVSDVLAREDYPSLKKLLVPYMHPHGIKEMAASMGLRMAYAAATLLRSLERGRAQERIRAIRSLRDEVLFSPQGHLRLNTARVLLQIMKELIRATDETERLMLARDFRQAATGKPRFVLRELRKHHLIEMSEDWNQLAFDDHVHDANTKGRKSATHLIMDAWIKGVRRLTVIYYDHVLPEVAEELLEAASAMGISVAVGIEFSASFRGRFVRLIWTPRGFGETKEFLDFLNRPEVQALMAEGRQASARQEQYVLGALEEWNLRHRAQFSSTFGIEAPEVGRREFYTLVGTGQPSLHHLGKLIHDRILPLLRARAEQLRPGGSPAPAQDAGLIRRMEELDIDAIVEDYLRPACNPHLPDPNRPTGDASTPPLLRHSPVELLERLTGLHPGSRITLNMRGLRCEDALEILFDCKGMITHLEIFNLKDAVLGRFSDHAQVMELQGAVNSKNAIRLKRSILSILGEAQSRPDKCPDQLAKLHHIQEEFNLLRAAYRKSVLRSRMGTDSTGDSRRMAGMGLVVEDTLPPKARRQLNAPDRPRWDIPVSIRVARRRTIQPPVPNGALRERLFGLLRRLPGLSGLGCRTDEDWLVRDYVAAPPEKSNVRTLGGVRTESDLLPGRQGSNRTLPPPRYMNSALKNGLKILLGFIPAFTSFLLTKDWPVLAYGGAFIWFGITGLRNVIQSVLGAGGVRRSPLLRWNDYVSWSRLADSLLYTGFSVPLLDWLVKSVILDKTFGVNTATAPLLMYAVMALVNGLYITTHNLFRGLPKSAAFGNLFRSVLSIPVAVVLNGAISLALAGTGTPDPAGVLQRFAAIISKLASDCAAAFIEGLADRAENIRLRIRDYREKLGRVYDVFAMLEILMPTQDLTAKMDQPGEFLKTVAAESPDLEKIVIVNALDLLYFWMYQPRARGVLARIVREMTLEERKVFLLSQYVLLRDREIAQLFLDGLVGKNFSKALAFYLDRSKEYLDHLHRIADKHPPPAGSRAKPGFSFSG